MANNQTTVQLIIEGNNVTAIKAIDGTVTKLNQMGNKAKEAQGPIDKLANALGLSTSQFTVGAVVAGMGLIIRNAIEAGDTLNDMSAKTGVAVETLSLLDYTAKLNGTTLDNVSTSIVRFNKNIYDASKGGGDAVNTFDDLGISLNDSNGKLKDSETLLLEVTKKFSSMENGIQKTAVAQKLFGKSGAESIAMLNDLGKNGEEYKKFLIDTGALITTQFAQAADRFNDNLATMNTALSGVGLKLADELLPSLTAVSVALVQISSDTNNTMPLVELLGTSIKSIATALGGVAVGAIIAGEALGTYWAALAKAATGDFSGAVDAVNKGFEQIKNTSLQVGKMFDAMWDPSKFQEQIDAIQKLNDAEAEGAKNKQTALQWVAQKERLNQEMILSGLNEQDQKIVRLIAQAKEYEKKFGGVAGAVETINAWFEKMANAQAPIKGIDVPIKYTMAYGFDAQSFASKQAGLFGETFYNQLALDSTKLQESNTLTNTLAFTPDLDLTKFLASKAIMEQGFSDISDNAMWHFTLMQDGVSDIFGNLAGAADNAYAAMGEKSRAFFDLYKAFSVAQAMIDTYKAAVGAYEAMVGIPVVGPTLAVIAAAAATAFGLSNVARIASMQPGTTGGGVSTGSATSYSSVASSSSTSNTTNNNSSKNISISININSEVLAGSDLDKWVRDNLSGSINKAINDGTISSFSDNG